MNKNAYSTIDLSARRSAQMGIRMNMDERIRRINELYHKSQAEGLTEEEKAEQAQLRKEYVASVRGNLKAQLDNISIERPDGTIEKLGKKHGKRQADGDGT